LFYGDAITVAQATFWSRWIFGVVGRVAQFLLRASKEQSYSLGCTAAWSAFQLVRVSLNGNYSAVGLSGNRDLNFSIPNSGYK
jgi:hypothetical protein